MSHQLTFADSEFSSKRRQTRKELFLSRMDQILPWQNMVAVIEPIYPKAALLLKSGNYPAVWRSDLLGSPPGVPDGQVQAQDQQLETVQPSLGATWFVDRLDG